MTAEAKRELSGPLAALSCLGWGWGSLRNGDLGMQMIGNFSVLILGPGTVPLLNTILYTGCLWGLLGLLKS